MKNNNDNELEIVEILRQMCCKEEDFSNKEAYKKAIDTKNMSQEYVMPYMISIKALNKLFEKGLENSTEFNLLEKRINRFEKLIELGAPTTVTDKEIELITKAYNRIVDLL